MVTLFRRHEASRNCKYLNRKKYPEPRKHKDCSCMMASDGYVETPTGERIPFRGSLHTRSWSDAEDIIKAKTLPHLRGETVKADPTIDAAVENFLKTKTTDLPARSDFGAESEHVLAFRKRTGHKVDAEQEQVRKYRDVLESLQNFSKEQDPPLIYLKQVTYDHLNDLRSTWKGRQIWKDGKLVGHHPKSQTGLQRYQQNIKIFFRHAVDAEWITKNPAKALTKITVKRSVIVPYTDQEWLEIFRMIEPTFPKIAKMVRAFVLVLKESALRISDVAKLRPEEIRAKGEVEIDAQKTRGHVFVSLPEDVIDALKAFTPKSARYYFWTGNGQLETAKKDWSSKMLKLFTAAKIEGGEKRRSHNFRKTLGIKVAELYGLDNAQIVLGHDNIGTTQKFYAQFTEGRKQRVREALDGVRNAEKARLKNIGS